jgi:PhnB protein
MASKSTRPIPEGYHSITPYLIVRGGVKAIEFYTKALNAKELFRMPMPDGSIGHAEMQIGDSRIMLCDALFAQAVKAGAEVDRPLANQFYGDRSGNIRDPFGHLWTIATNIEEVSPEEMQRRMSQQQQQ